MANVIVDDTNLKNIANAIRDKNGETATYKPSEMATAIGEIDLQDNSIVNSLIDRSITEFSNDTLTTIGSYAFAKCRNLVSVYLPNITKISECGFFSTSLSSIDFPKVTSIGYNAFQYCENVTSVSLPNLIYAGNNSFEYCNNLTYVMLPELTTLNNNVFRSLQHLTTADFPKVTTIYGYAFASSYVFDTLILRSTEMATLKATSAFENTPISGYNQGTGYIYVPSGLVDEYKSATNWSTYAEQIRAIEDYPEITGG